MKDNYLCHQIILSLPSFFVGSMLFICFFSVMSVQFLSRPSCSPQSISACQFPISWIISSVRHIPKIIHVKMFLPRHPIRKKMRCPKRGKETFFDYSDFSSSQDGSRSYAMMPLGISDKEEFFPSIGYLRPRLQIYVGTCQRRLEETAFSYH